MTAQKWIIGSYETILDISTDRHRPIANRRGAGLLFFALVLLISVAPLFAWRKQTVQRLGKAMWLPSVGSIILSIGWGYSHRMHPASIAGLWLVAFVLLAILAKFWKGIQARRKARGEGLGAALLKLIGRNRRRYGGYIIHLGVVLIALGFIGDAFFKSETQGTIPVGETITINNYELRFDRLLSYPSSDGREVYEAQTVLMADGEKEVPPEPVSGYARANDG